mgnify:CR=1 FL=1
MAERLQERAAPAGAAAADEPGYACVSGAWRQHEQELRGFLVNRLADGDAAEDLVQEVFLRAMREGAGFCRLDSPRAWLFRVARNAAVDRQRRERPAEPVPEDLAAEEPQSAPVDDLNACIKRNLPALRESDRDIIRHCDLEGRPQRDYAEALGLSVGAVKTRLFRARQRLRERLVQQCRVRFDEDGRVCCHTPPEGDA